MVPHFANAHPAKVLAVFIVVVAGMTLVKIFVLLTVLPCSHGGGRFGQSLTAISKLAPKATLTAGLSIHYSGGSSLSKDVEKWLKKCGVK